MPDDKTIDLSSPTTIGRPDPPTATGTTIPVKQVSFDGGDDQVTVTHDSQQSDPAIANSGSNSNETAG